MAGEIHLSLCQRAWVTMSSDGPAQCKGLELLLTQFAGDDDGGQEREAHADADALLHRFDAGELGDMAGTDVLEGEGAIEFGAIAASSSVSSRCWPARSAGLTMRRLVRGWLGIATEKDSLSAQARGIEAEGLEGVSHMSRARSILPVSSSTARELSRWGRKAISTCGKRRR